MLLAVVLAMILAGCGPSVVSQEVVEATLIDRHSLDDGFGKDCYVDFMVGSRKFCVSVTQTQFAGMSVGDVYSARMSTHSNGSKTLRLLEKNPEGK